MAKQNVTTDIKRSEKEKDKFKERYRVNKILRKNNYSFYQHLFQPGKDNIDIQKNNSVSGETIREREGQKERDRKRGIEKEGGRARERERMRNRKRARRRKSHRVKELERERENEKEKEVVGPRD